MLLLTSDINNTLAYKSVQYIHKIIALISILAAFLIISAIAGNNCIYAIEETLNSGNVSKRELINKNIDSCTERCHVNFMAYEKEFDSTKRPEIFRHITHSVKQDLDCVACHKDDEVNTEGHGKLTIEQNDCLKCHHVGEADDYQCKICHTDIDTNPMTYKEEKFLHGFAVDSDVDCGLCHIKDPEASMKDQINCVKCHHTTPDLNCAKCHENDLKQTLNADPDKKTNLSWTVSFDHSQHSEKDLACKECHSITHDNDAGIVEYNLNCTKCHHSTEERIVCAECHKEPSDYLNGVINVKDFEPVPDMMSKMVKCEDCHKFDEKELKFSDVRLYCIECHNNDYGMLYDARENTIKDRLNKLNKHITSLYEKEEWIKQHSMDTFIEEAEKLVDMITKYGIHNFNTTRSVLDYLENKTNTIMQFDN